jgi:ribonuclease R
MKKNDETLSVKGILRVHPRGFGFVVPANRLENPQDIFIPAHMIDGAVDGDEVEAEVFVSSLSSEKGPEGKIVFIIKRGREHTAGIVQEIGSGGVARVFAPLLGVTRPVMVNMEKKKQKLTVGDRVIVLIKNWGGKKAPAQGEVCHHLGNISDASIDIKAAIEEFDLESEFSKEAIKEAKAFGLSVKASEAKGRKNLKDTVCFTIDPKTARDFDDALSLKKDAQGNYHLAVHIADVAHYVKEGSELDKEAKERCNSTYFPGACNPMLPEELSNHLCSLKPNVVRAAVSVFMSFDKNANLTHSQILRTLIKSKKRFTYEEAKQVIDKKKKSPHAPILKLMVEFCLLLKQKRAERGSIDFSLPETILEVDKKGEPKGFTVSEYDISHQLVEEFMLKANEVVATTLSKRGSPVMYRTHEEPSEENRLEFCEFARSLSFFLPENPTKKDLQKLFDEAAKSPFAYQLTVAFIRSMKLAVYSPENIGHYGLALENYCHFTSPIRRYSDLITQRLLFDEQSETADLKEIALLCSEKERISFRAEMSVKNLKKLRYLKKQFDEDPHRTYNAIVSRIKPFGLLFEIPPLMIEGFLHISHLENDYFIYDSQRSMLVGRRTGKIHKMGETLKVKLLSVDLIVQESKWELTEAKRRPHHKRRKR